MTTPASGPATLVGTVALVTGGARGIGRTIAHALADVGADIVVLDREAPDVTVGSLQARRLTSGARRMRSL